MSKRITYDCDKCGKSCDEPVSFTVEVAEDQQEGVDLCPGCAGKMLHEFVDSVLPDHESAQRWMKTYAPLVKYR